jgi:hypothetical protein
MTPAPKQRTVYGRYVDHEKELAMPSRPPLTEGPHILPETTVVGNYRISFLGKVFGGYEVNIVRTDGIVIARNAKIRRFMEKRFLDPVTDTTVYIKLNISDSAVIRLTAFEEAAVDERKT